MKSTALGLAHISSRVRNSPLWGVCTRYKGLSTLRVDSCNSSMIVILLQCFLPVSMKLHNFYLLSMLAQQLDCQTCHVDIFGHKLDDNFYSTPLCLVSVFPFQVLLLCLFVWKTIERCWYKVIRLKRTPPPQLLLDLN